MAKHAFQPVTIAYQTKVIHKQFKTSTAFKTKISHTQLISVTFELGVQKTYTSSSKFKVMIGSVSSNYL